ncbi:MAG: FAD-dependent oxidoreductase [Chloroflexi bacterium]|nr:FAD-dependent oxidoreductase [Chloroflexota bacterium]MBV9892645.1 FAD-dependent oxidoreductase [Chloroflexota bacterium]
MKDDPDVVVVGAGIAGASMATVPARAGIEVLLLEPQQAPRATTQPSCQMSPAPYAARIRRAARRLAKRLCGWDKCAACAECP